MDLTPALDAVPFAQRRRYDRDKGRLVGTRCADCHAVSWPGRPICHRCGSPNAHEVTLSDRGVLITFTQVWVPRPGLPTPYVLGQVDLADGVRIFAHGRGIDDDAHVPLPVRLVLNEAPDVVPPFYFEAVEVS